MEKRLRLALGHTESPTSTLLILWIFPEWLDTLTEDMDCVSSSDLFPGVVVIDPVEGGDIGNVVVEHIQLVIGGFGMLLVPHSPVILERQGTEFAKDILMERSSSRGHDGLVCFVFGHDGGCVVDLELRDGHDGGCSMRTRIMNGGESYLI